MSNDKQAIEDANKQLVLTVIEVIFNRMELDRLEEFFTEDFYNHDGFPGAPTGPDAFRQYLPFFKQGIPDRWLTPEFTLADGDRVISRTITTGTMTGKFMGMEPTGKKYRMTATDTYQLRDGKICARWGNEDSLGMMQQLGMIPGGWRTATNDDEGSLEADYADDS